jgi:hypothetical protein
VAGRIRRMPYPTPTYIDPEPRCPGFHDAHCEVTWTPHDPAGTPRRISGAYLDAPSAGGQISLGCGIEEALHDLGISELIEYEHLVDVADLVSRQLAEHPWAEVKCAAGVARVELVPRRVSAV